jgi:hypothetical protein
VISWCQGFAFKWVNVCRYAAGAQSPLRALPFHAGALVSPVVVRLRSGAVVGLYTLNAADPSPESAWFQPLNLKMRYLVSKFACKCNL